MFMDSSCKDEKKLSSLVFSLYDKNNQIVKDTNNKQYTWMSSYMGQGWLVFDNLPAGEYSLRVRGSSGDKSLGDMPFTVQTFGLDEKVNFN